MRFKSWPNLDVVPARGIRDYDGTVELPDMRREVWLGIHPKAHARRIAEAASVHGPNLDASSR